MDRTVPDAGGRRPSGSVSAVPDPIRIVLTTLFEFLRWTIAGFEPPTPSFIKRRLLRRHALAGGAWVETGTYRGDTTSFLARGGTRVESLEPMPDLCEAARRRFAGRTNITIHGASSEEAFAAIVERLEGPINFWLDGHYSGGATFAGADDTPILHELDVIGEAIGRRSIRVAVLIDDVRLFVEERRERPEQTTRGYPPFRVLTEWAERHGLRWSVEHDVLVAITP